MVFGCSSSVECLSASEPLCVSWPHPALFSWFLNHYGCRCQGKRQVVLISCSRAVTPLFNTALWPFPLCTAQVWCSQFPECLKGKSTHCCEEGTLCVLSVTHSADTFPLLHGWAHEGPATLVILFLSFLSHIFLSQLILCTGEWSPGFGKAREGLGTAEICVSLLDQNIAVIWLRGRSMEYLTETVPTQKVCWGNDAKKSIRLSLIENEGFGLQ